VNSKSVLCVIRHVVKEPYITIQSKGQESTWLTERLPTGFEVIHFHGKPAGKILSIFDRIHEYIRLNHGYIIKFIGYVEDILLYPLLRYIPKTSSSNLLTSNYPVLLVNFPDIYLTIRWKFFTIFDHFVRNTHHDFLFITTTNAYIIPLNLMKYLESIPKSRVYTGAYTWPNSFFISGANIILSRDVVEKLLESMKYFRASVIDDVELSNVLKQLGISHFGKPLISISSNLELQSISRKIIDENFHFRMKTVGHREVNEVELMQQMHERVKNLRENHDE
jgi:hypothetical protein